MKLGCYILYMSKEDDKKLNTDFNGDSSLLKHKYWIKEKTPLILYSISLFDLDCIKSMSQLIWNVYPCNSVNKQVWNYGYSSEKGNFVESHWPGAPHSTGWNRQRPQCPALVCQTSWSVFHRICLRVCNLQKENWQNVHQIFTS